MLPQQPIYIVDIIGDVVSKAQAVLLPKLQAYDSTIVNIRYEYGPWKEIQTTLMQMSDQSDNQKYPLVALIFPFTEQHGVNVGIDDDTPIRLIIARWANNTDKTADRYANNFKPVLYPVYLELLNQFDNDKRFEIQDSALVGHTKTDWPYYGGDESQDNNFVIDYIDAIELKIKLKILTSNCY